MNLNIKKPIVFFDLETTGLNTAQDRIIQLSFMKVSPDGKRDFRTKRVNPGIPIPPEATALHGITDEDVKDIPIFKTIARSLSVFLDGCDLAGFNIIRFDVPILIEEFHRTGIDFDVSNRKFVDAQHIFHLMEPRSLKAAYKFYCGQDLENAHSAEADTLATFEVLNAQITHYAGRQIENKKGELYAPITSEVEDLHNLAFEKVVDLAGRLTFNEKGQVIFNFGKYKSMPVLEVFAKDPSYYAWMMRSDFPLNTKQKLEELYHCR